MAKSAVMNAADPEQVKKAGKKDQRTRDRQLDDMRGVMSSLEGRRFMWRWLSECGVFKSSFTGNSQTFFLEGQRNIGLMMLTDINESDPTSYVTMLTEAKGVENE